MRTGPRCTATWGRAGRTGWPAVSMARACPTAPWSISATIMNAVVITEIQSPLVVACCPYASACRTSPSCSAIDEATEAARQEDSGHPCRCASRSQVCTASRASPVTPAYAGTTTASASAAGVRDISCGIDPSAAWACRIAWSRSTAAAASSTARLACSWGSRSSPASARACSRPSTGQMTGRVCRSQRAALSRSACSRAAVGERSSPGRPVPPAPRQRRRRTGRTGERPAER